MPKYFLGIVEHEDAYGPDGPADFDTVMAAHSDFSAAVRAAGASVLGGEALQPVSTATFLRGTRTDAVRPVDNPLPEVTEVFGGYYVIEARDDAQALELARLCPAPYGYVELRPVWEFGDGDSAGSAGASESTGTAAATAAGSAGSASA
ncbi:YciI family protein [Nakamurella endophytica]|uniref:YCII-related domain-containing protein n=1 Tax=Nakamurella endophytica TaxID=1748367 RepID=A0A917TB62_9ACTN|nr:YciI family protein [Nakamurella endophytica]GGM14194.1 hypothetical protein GCM10011594_37780 [Nakamurella endophytica]